MGANLWLRTLVDGVPGQRIVVEVEAEARLLGQHEHAIFDDDGAL
jgi:hypothetical protein